MPPDPILEQTRGLFAAHKAADVAKRGQAVGRALTQFGAVPEFQGFESPFLEQDVTDQTRKLAQQATGSGVSTLAQLTKAHQDALRGIPNQLAARGMLRSSTLPFQLEEENLRHRIATNQEQQKLIDFLSGAYGAFGQAERERQLGLLQAEQESNLRALERKFREQDFQLAQQGLQLQQQGLAQSAQQAAAANALQAQGLAQSAAADAAARQFQEQQLAQAEAAAAAPPFDLGAYLGGALAPAGASGTFQWGDRTWGAGDGPAFRQWMAAHGGNYNQWAVSHPGAAAKLG